MLKHKPPSRPNSLVGSLSQLSDSALEIPEECNNSSFDKGSARALKRSVSVGDFHATSLLSKQDMKRIILRRKSDLIRKQIGKPKMDTSWDSKNAEPLDDAKLTTNRQESEESLNSKEIIEEVQLDNSMYMVHKRKKSNKNNESIVSELSVTREETSLDNSDKKYEISDSGMHNSDEKQDGKSEHTTVKNYWISTDLLPSVDPVAVSSPTNEKPCLELADNSTVTGTNRDVRKRTEGYDVNRRGKHSSHNATNIRKSSSLRTQRENSSNSARSADGEYAQSETCYKSMQYIPSPSIQSYHIPQRLDNLKESQSRFGTMRSLEVNSYLANNSLNGSPRFSDARSIHPDSSASNIIPMNSSGVSSQHVVKDVIVDNIADTFQYDRISKSRNKVYQDQLRCCRMFTIFLIIVSVIGTAIGGFLHFYISQDPREDTLNEGDVKFLTVSPIFCSGLRAFSDSSDVRLITFDMNKQAKAPVVYSRKAEIKINSKQVWKRGYYLMGGSQITIKIKTNYLIEILIFEGEKSYSLWTERKESKNFLLRKYCCSNKKYRKDSITFTAQSNEQFIIVLYNSVEHIPVDITELVLAFNRTSYTFKKHSSLCQEKAGNICEVDLDFNSKETIAIEAPLSQEGNQISKEFTFRYECISRIWFYVVFYLSVFVGTFALIMLFYCICARKLITSKQCCCYKHALKAEYEQALFYDNHGFLNDDLAAYVDAISNANSTTLLRLPKFTNNNGDESYYSLDQNDSASHIYSRLPSRLSQPKLSYGSKVRRNLSRQTSRASSYHPSIYHKSEIGVTNDIASIYREELDFSSSTLDKSGNRVAVRRMSQQNRQHANNDSNISHGYLKIQHYPAVVDINHHLKQHKRRTPRRDCSFSSRNSESRRYLSYSSHRKNFTQNSNCNNMNSVVKNKKNRIPTERIRKESIVERQETHPAIQMNAFDDEQMKKIEYDVREIFI